MFRTAVRTLSPRLPFVGVSRAALPLVRYNQTATKHIKLEEPTEPYHPPVTLDRELPDPFAKQKQNRKYFIVYGLGVALSCIITFNYEKTRSPIITSTLFFLRRSEISKQQLGGGIDYKSSWPWISGPLNTVKGDIDISFDVKGDRSGGTVKLRASRESKQHPFVVHHFLLAIDGKDFDLTKDPKIDFII